MSEPTELLCCPFCGGEADVMLTQGRYGQSYSIHHESHGNCAAKYVNTVNFRTEAEAIEAWNTRHERTCELRKASWDDGMCTWGVICSECGDRHEHESGVCWKYCPSCGAKVIEEAD